MSGGGDSGEKSEKATAQRMKQVHRDGKLSRSQDLTAWVGLAAAAIMLPGTASRAADAAFEQLGSVREAIASPDAGTVTQLLGDGLWSVVGTIGPMLAVVAGVVIAVAVAQGGVHVKKFKPNVQQFNPVSGVKRLFGAHAWWEGAKTLLKTAVVGTVLYLAVQALVPQLMGTGRIPLAHMLGVAGSGVKQLLVWGVSAGVLLAAVDLLVVIRRNRKQTRMSRQEIKEENKRTEGDPLVKGQIRSKQMAMSRNRMMAAVADADVVIVNPTHVAVALKYVPGTGAPRLVAKGAGAVAARIRAQATEHRVPMVEDVPLARALHAACAVDQEIPAYLFTAVARVLAFVMQLKRRGAAMGRHTMPGGSVAPDDVPTTVAAARRRMRAEKAA
ncbi:EscU/YscU/HrcU family type III secretion system export apparatus switch protein [Cellulomonas sp. ES6]|uniref:EscU/YscU/HrcU family type III secretion system export apparatus switch protein n=1 Tax=Cellulomonas sp. ES6 TaxID=3039384 RepID=UPI0019C27FE7|nr:EscU/YscU/HrcU family type III secretion system export apparatus switch protein [Cellulomonas sp. ES6]MBD3780914.1 EscU/YscU/HrcU family type III secretion system export apparatus switch protein [Micrococcales bacterium]WHP19012.1 EscU/YscU/HrcU family type III secretion system export apparatus switch protein [Cellulomonas sp. ES6]